MTIEVSVNIRHKRDRVINLFRDTHQFGEWMTGFIKHEQISGEAGVVGAQSKMTFRRGKKEMTMTETIIVNDLPKAIHTEYVAPGVFINIENHFEELDNGTTEYRVIQSFKFDSFAPKLVGKLFPSLFKKPSLKNMTAFKDWAEKQPA